MIEARDGVLAWIGGLEFGLESEVGVWDRRTENEYRTIRLSVKQNKNNKQPNPNPSVKHLVTNPGLSSEIYIIIWKYKMFKENNNRNMIAFGTIIGSVVFGTLLYTNLPTRLTIGAVVPTVKYLAETRLKLVEPGKGASAILTGKEVRAQDLFQTSPTLVMAVRRPGCAFCRKEATHLCGLASQLAEKGVKVIGVVHETQGVDEFRPFLGCADAIYFDSEKRFFGPQQRWLPLWMGFLRLSTYINLYKTKMAGIQGNTEGEGRLLGGVYLVDKDKMLFSHLEQGWGDEASLDELMAIVQKI